MAIDRQALVTRHNPVLHHIDTSSPLSVGNGELAFTADITGMQTLYDTYKEKCMPLCTQTQWGWHTIPVSEEKYEYDRKELVETEYDFHGRTVTYPVKCKEGNEAVYHWLRQNPHRMNMARIGLVKRTDSTSTEFQEIRPEEISDITQTLHMEQGIIDSIFTIYENKVTVQTYCAMDQDALGFSIESENMQNKSLAVLVSFPYGSPDISASDWNQPEKHTTEVKYVKQENTGSHECEIVHTLDRDSYHAYILAEGNFTVEEAGAHQYLLIPEDAKASFDFTVHFTQKVEKNYEEAYVLPAVVKKNAVNGWQAYWNKTGVIDLHESKDERALELERRIVLSQYLMAINSSGSMPPQETGLTCNSWYGKFHLEMYFWHEAYLPLWGRSDMLAKSLDWFVEHLPEARENAAKNGYIGARWPKMVAADGKDSPSPIAPLLLWQQPHIIYMIDLMYRDTKDLEFLKKYEVLIRETADFMADIAVKNEQGEYELLSPVIPVQECHAPEMTKNPTFEVEYWVVTLRMALELEKLLGDTATQQIEKNMDKWREVADNMISSPIQDGIYLAHSNCSDTYENYAIDHPSMLMALGTIDSGRMQKDAMRKSLEKVIEVWDFQSLWGWDFAVMAMTATKLGTPELAIDLLLKDTWKNMYVVSGNNRQESRDDLPLYLPGNGSLLLAAAMMAAGYDGCETDCPGFPKDGNWTIAYEGIHQLP